MRGYLRTLAETGVVEKHQGSFPGAVGYELTTAGRELVEVSELLGAWLRCSPRGSIELGSVEAKRAIKALVDGWSTSMVRALASRPLSLTELNSVITSLSYPSLERRLSAMRMLGLVEAAGERGRGRPYGAGDWLRRAVGPITTAARWEARHWPKDAVPTTNRDIESAFLLGLPLLHLPTDATGFCRLAVQMRKRDVTRLAGVIVEVREGTVVSCIARLKGRAHGWAVGSIGAWFAAILDGERRGLEFGGEQQLAVGLTEGLQDALAAEVERHLVAPNSV